MKKLYLFSLLMLGFLSAMAQSPLSVTVPWATICPNTPYQVYYNDVATTYQPGNVFTVQLSGPTGSFLSPTVIGTLQSTNQSGAINVGIGQGALPAGSAYRIRVVASNPAITGSDNGSNITRGDMPVVTITPQNSMVCQGAALNLTASGASSYVWGPAQTLSDTTGSIVTATPASGGTYYVTGTNAQGCQASANTQVNINSSIYIASNQPICPGQDLLLTAFGSGGVLSNISWSGPNGFTSTSQLAVIPNLQPAQFGTYTVTANVGNCPNTSATFEAGLPTGPLAFSNSPVCEGATINLFADSLMFGVGYSWTGPNGFTSNVQNPVITNVTAANAGTYTVQGVMGNCLSAPSLVQVNLTNTLSVNANGPSSVLQGSNIVLYASGSSGNYQWTGPNNFTASGTQPYIINSTPAHSGIYTVSLSSGNCPTVSATVPVQVMASNQITGIVYNDLNNNGVQDAGEAPRASVLVRAMPDNYYALSDSMGNYELHVPAGTYTLTAANLPNSQTANPANYSVGFTGTGQVSAGNDFGIFLQPSQNLGVSITQVWNASPGFETYHRISAKNHGTSPMDGTIRYVTDAMLTVNAGTSAGYTMSADTLVWSFTNLMPNQTIQRHVYLQVPSSTSLGTVLSTAVVITPIAGDVNPGNNVYNLNQTVVGSWDPNDKLVQPEGPITVQQAADGIDLVYTVRFQNTGTAPAINVLLLDTLSSLLDLSTFQMLSGSHPYYLNIRNPRVLEWHFPGIMLPDSTTNEPESHGYVQYTIRPLTNQTVGNLIENTAHIFFDFNEAIVTNTTVTELGVLSTPKAISTQGMELYPNPNNGTFNIKLSECAAGPVVIRLINALGQEVHTETAVATGTTFDRQLQIQNLTDGMYLLQVQQGEKVQAKRVVMQR